MEKIPTTWEELRKMEKPIIRLESRINFETLKRGHPMRINENNHGFKKQGSFDRASKRILEFMSIAENGTVKCYSEEGSFLYYNYKYLLIL